MKYKNEFITSISCLLLALLLSVSYIQKRDESLAARIAPEILRFHVLANSDNKEDQKLKLEVRTLILNAMYDVLGENATKDETRNYILSHHSDLETLAETYIEEEGYSYSVRMELEDTYFPTKIYGDMVFPSGYYEAARVIIGDGDGRNWWCVLYPPLCFVDSTYAVVPDESKQTLKSLLAEDDFAALMQSHALEQAPKKKGEPKVKVKFKLLELLTE